MKKEKSKRNTGESAPTTRLEQQMRDLVNYNLDGMLVISLDGFALFANPAACKLLNRPLASLLDVEIGLPLSGEDYTEIEIRNPDGSLATVEMRVHGIEWDGKPAWLASLRDITWRKQTEQALRTSEEHHRQVSSLMSDYVYYGVAFPNGTVKTEWVRGAFELITSYTQDEVNQLPGGFSAIIVPEDLQTVMRRQVDLITNGTFSTEYRIRRKDGEIRWLRDYMQFLAGDGLGSKATIVGAVQDITERKQAEDARDVNLIKLRTLFESFPLGITISDKDGSIVEANPMSARLLGISQEEHHRRIIDGSEWKIVRTDGTPMPPDEFASVRALREKHIVENVEMGIVNKDNAITWISVTAAPLPLDDYGVVVTYGDISKRKRTETALRESEEKMRSIFRASPTGIGVVQDRVLLDVNPRICEMTGYTKEELVGNNARMLYPTQADFDFVGREKYSQIVEKGAGQVETRWRKKDGTVIDILLSSTPIDLSNHARGVIFTALDITERKKAEIGLSRYASQLENAEKFAKLGSWEFDVAAGKGWWSKQMYRMFGFENSDHAPDFDTYLKRIHPEDRHTVEDDLNKMSRGEEPTPQEYRSNPEFGPMRQFLPTVYTQKDKAGNPIRFIGTLLDVTDSRKAERTIEQQNKDLRLINLLNEFANRGDDLDSILNEITREAQNSFNAQNVALFLLTPDGNYLEMNSSKFSPQATVKIETLLETSISKLLIRLDDSPLIRALLANNQGSIINSPQELQQWLYEIIFMSVNIPSEIRALAGELAPQIYKISDINSAISVPLVSSQQAIGMICMFGKGDLHDDDLQRVQNIAHQITTIILRQKAEADVRRQLQRITALNQIDRAISGSLDMRLSLDVLLGEVRTQLGVDAAGVLLLNPVDQSLEFIVGKGFRSSILSLLRMPRMSLGEGFAGQVGVERKVLHIPNLPEKRDSFLRAELFKGENFIEYFGVPLVAKGVLKGVLEIFNRTPLNTRPDWQDYLETLGGQAAIAIDNAQMFESMQRSNQELITAYDATILGWSLAMDLRDKETEGHTQRVTELTIQLARRMGISQQDLVHIRRGALLHDIGKLGVPDHILLKPEPLSQIEWAIMRQHPTYAYKMLLPIHYLRPALEIPYCHHEKWDGTGYPRGLKGENIPIAARIFAVVDVWDALRANRPYRKSWSVEETRLYIQNEAGRHFDPEIAAEFIKLLDETAELQ